MISCGCSNGATTNTVRTTIVIDVAATTTKRISMVRRCCGAPLTTAMSKAIEPARPIAKMVGASIRKTHMRIEDASYGYDGYYVDLNEYQYYFREGFRRGYEDGYRNSSRYGRYNNGTEYPGRNTRRDPRTPVTKLRRVKSLNCRGGLRGHPFHCRLSIFDCRFEPRVNRHPKRRSNNLAHL